MPQTTGPAKAHDEDSFATARLVLRRLESADVAALHLILSDAEAMRYWSTLPHGVLAQTEEFVARTMRSCAAGESDDFAVLHEGALIGKTGLWAGNEIGFIFSRKVWGSGLPREAIAAVLERGFARGVSCVRADVDPRNVRALGLLARFGFVETGRAERTFKLGEEWADSLYLEKRR